MKNFKIVIEAIDDGVYEAVDLEEAQKIAELECENVYNRLHGRYSVSVKSIEEFSYQDSDITESMRNGKWICTAVRCSECDFKVTTEADTAVEISEYKHCPNCGAKMKED